MYESPVNPIFQDIERQIVQKQEQTIINAIRACGVAVNKEELIKAINYDRNQYSKGYKDGVNDVLDKIRAEIEERKLNSGGEPNRELAFNVCLKIIDKYKAERK